MSDYWISDSWISDSWISDSWISDSGISDSWISDSWTRNSSISDSSPGSRAAARARRARPPGRTRPAAHGRARECERGSSALRLRVRRSGLGREPVQRSAEPHRGPEPRLGPGEPPGGASAGLTWRDAPALISAALHRVHHSEAATTQCLEMVRRWSATTEVSRCSPAEASPAATICRANVLSGAPSLRPGPAPKRRSTARPLHPPARPQV